MLSNGTGQLIQAFSPSSEGARQVSLTADTEFVIDPAVEGIHSKYRIMRFWADNDILVSVGPEAPYDSETKGYKVFADQIETWAIHPSYKIAVTSDEDATLGYGFSA